jgi:hypothetical protein
MRVRSEDVQRLEGVLSRYDKRSTIGILVARFEHRIICAQRDVDIFTDCAKDRARSSEYNIILTDELNMYSDLINFIEVHQLDGSNNRGWGTREEINLIVRRIETEIREEMQRWREEMEQGNRELRSEIMRMGIEQVEIQRGMQREFLRRDNREAKFFLIFFSMFSIIIFMFLYIIIYK